MLSAISIDGGDDRVTPQKLEALNCVEKIKGADFFTPLKSQDLGVVLENVGDLFDQILTLAKEKGNEFSKSHIVKSGEASLRPVTSTHNVVYAAINMHVQPDHKGEAYSHLTDKQSQASKDGRLRPQDQAVVALQNEQVLDKHKLAKGMLKRLTVKKVAAKAAQQKTPDQIAAEIEAKKDAQIAADKEAAELLGMSYEEFIQLNAVQNNGGGKGKGGR